MAPSSFFDLDNTLYRKSSGIAELMAQRIELFFQTYLHLPEAESRVLGAKFYRDYGLAIKGLIKHFAIDPGSMTGTWMAGFHLIPSWSLVTLLTSLLDRLLNKELAGYSQMQENLMPLVSSNYWESTPSSRE